MDLSTLAALIAAHLHATGREPTAANIADAWRYLVEKGGAS